MATLKSWKNESDKKDIEKACLVITPEEDERAENMVSKNIWGFYTYEL